MPTDPGKVSELRAILDDRVTACHSCVPWGDGDPIWMGPHAKLADLVPWWDEKFDFDDDVIEEVLKDYRCPHCGTDLDGACKVRYKSEQERKAEETIAKACDEAMVDRLEAFSDFLAKYPYLGACDAANTGHEIIKAIEAAKSARIHKQTLYRARLLNVESRLYKCNEMGAPNPKSVFVKEGRYNHTGQSFLYLSDSEWTALAEVSSGRENVCVIQKYEVENLDSILDLTRDCEELDPDKDVLRVAIIYNGYVRKKPDDKSSWKPEYFVPRFLADAARFRGFAGIQFSSAFTHGVNLVLFDTNHPRSRQVGDPYLYEKEEDAHLSPVGLLGCVFRHKSNSPETRDSDAG